MKRDELLTKVKNYVPFIWDDRHEVEWGGTCPTIKEAWTHTHHWEGGTDKEGELLLDSNGDVVGNIIHYHTYGYHEELWEDIEECPAGEACYLLSYRVVYDSMRYEEYATLYELD